MTINAQTSGISRRKQSKSRNGCMTCKKKRLKCDETKPTCVQCERRNVECEGYKKDYKWKFFEDTRRQPKVGKSRRTQDVVAQPAADAQLPATLALTLPVPDSNEDNRPISPSPRQRPTSPKQITTPQARTAPLASPPRQLSPSHFDPLPIFSRGFSPTDLDLPSPRPSSSNQQSLPEVGSLRSSHSIASPVPLGFLLPELDLAEPPGLSEMRPSMSPPPPDEVVVEQDSSLFGATNREMEVYDEEVTRYPTEPCMVYTSEMQWEPRAPSPANSDASSTHSRSTEMSILKAPPLDPSSAEMLMLRFDKETCGILSIVDGPDENPWRTLVWPLAKNSPALYHAILAMAALHGGASVPRLRLIGMAHMTTSISKLSADMHRMSLDQTLATALALALGESWDERISTGIQHLKGARSLLGNSLAERAQNLQFEQSHQEDAKRLRFLTNTYVYLDGIARLTSSDDQDGMDLGRLLEIADEPFGNMDIEIDPLMGCATTLFPLLGQVGSLIQRIRRTDANSLSVISEANELREQLLHWEPPDMALIEQPADPSSSVRHAIQTAEAYRRAILLHLHHAVTELASEPSYDQAKGILTLLAGTPTSSRTMVVQIFPLLVGSCEMVTEEDRQWVTKRWEAMSRRLNIVNVTSSWKVVQEVWRRRDCHSELPGQRFARFAGRDLRPNAFLPRDMTMGPSVTRKRQLVQLPRRHTDISLLNGEPDYTVRGHLHWLGVMSDWDWEVFL